MSWPSGSSCWRIPLRRTQTPQAGRLVFILSRRGCSPTNPRAPPLHVAVKVPLIVVWAEPSLERCEKGAHGIGGNRAHGLRRCCLFSAFLLVPLLAEKGTEPKQNDTYGWSNIGAQNGTPKWHGPKPVVPGFILTLIRFTQLGPEPQGAEL